jgi:hypothetical protein
MDKGRLVLWILAAVFGLALVGALVYKAWPLLYPELIGMAPLDPTCNLRAGPCWARLPGAGEIRFGIEPRSLPAAQPLRLEVRTAGLDVAEISVDFSGVDMNMGFNRIQLQQTEPGRFEGGGTLPVCVRSRMIWEAKVLVRTPEGLVAAPFRFETASPGS